MAAPYRDLRLRSRDGPSRDGSTQFGNVSLASFSSRPSRRPKWRRRPLPYRDARFSLHILACRRDVISVETDSETKSERQRGMEGKRGRHQTDTHRAAGLSRLRPAGHRDRYAVTGRPSGGRGSTGEAGAAARRFCWRPPSQSVELNELSSEWRHADARLVGFRYVCGGGTAHAGAYRMVERLREGA